MLMHLKYRGGTSLHSSSKKLNFYQLVNYSHVNATLVLHRLLQIMLSSLVTQMTTAHETCCKRERAGEMCKTG